MEFILEILNIMTEEIDHFNSDKSDQLFDYQIAFEVLYESYQQGDYKKISKILDDYSFNIHTFVKIISRYQLKNFIKNYTQMLRIFNNELELYM